MTMSTALTDGAVHDAISAAKLVENLLGLAWASDPDGECTYVTPGQGESMLSALRELGIAQASPAVQRTIHPADLPKAVAAWRSSLAAGSHFDVECRISQAEGCYTRVRCSAQPSYDDEGKITGWYGTFIRGPGSAQSPDKEEAGGARDLQELVDTVPALIWCTTPDGTPSYINKRLADTVGVSLGDLIGSSNSKSFADIHMEDVPMVERALTHSFETGTSFVATYRQLRSDGSYRWTEGRAEPLRDDKGVITQWYGVCVDVHDRVIAQEALQEQERHLRRLVDAMPSLTWCLSPDGQPSYYSKQLARWLGLSVEELDGRGVSRLQLAETLLVHPEDGRAAHEALAQCVRTGEPFNRRYRVRRHDGQFRWMDVRAQALRDERGQIVQWYGVLIDIEDLMRAQEGLRHRERELSQLIDMVPSHIWRLSAVGEPMFFNKRMVDFLGWNVEDREEGSGLLSLLKAIHPEDVKAFETSLGQSIENGDSFAMRYRLRRADGEYRWMSGRAEPVRDDRGHVVQWFGLCHDIDDQMRLYTEVADREAKIRRLVDSDIIGIVIWDLDGTLIDANDAFLSMIQYDRADVANGLNWLNITPPEWQQVHALEEAEELAATGKMEAREKEYFRKDGSRVPVLIGAACFEGDSRQGLAYILDLTERKRAEAALRDRERELSQLVDMVPIPLWRLGSRGEPIFFNKRMADFIGHDPNNSPSSDGLNFVELVAARTHPEDVELVTEAFHNALLTGEPLSVSYRLKGPAGAYRWVLSNSEPLRDHSGQIVGWYGFSHDVDDQLRVEEALRERERFLWQVVETLPAMIDCAAPDGEPIYRSQQLREFLGYELGALDETGRSRLAGTLDAGVHPDDLAGVREDYAHSLSTGEPYARRHRLRRHDGEYRWVETRAAPMRDLSGAIIQWNVICLDIDREVKAQEELRLAQERLAQATQAASLAELSASIAHEINQPLAAVVTNSHACQRWLKMHPPNLERAQRTVDRIVRDANAAADVIRRIRGLFRKSDEPRSLLSFEEIVSDTRRVLADLARSARVDVSLSLSGDIGHLLFDGVQTQQILLNLMRNAVEAMDGQSAERRLAVKATRSGEVAHVEVSDTGPGIINPENIFDAFFTTKRTGMGMGLAISRSMVESLGGKIWFRNNDDRGATFAFTLPIGSEANA
ncbi:MULTISPECIES: PAS domain-containing protein [Sphingomonas]|nr:MULTISPECIES: PAS domain-containing protein [Sphingomonas]MBA2920862.1 PAS domain-containing protein [Sphingomonas sp. CGMCC 1.13658]